VPGDAAVGVPYHLIDRELPLVARKPNYDFERRKKEMERKAKKEAKREERARRKAAGLPEDDGLEGIEGGEPDGDEDGDSSSDDEAAAPVD
jgi:hypothetical protein